MGAIQQFRIRIPDHFSLRFLPCRRFALSEPCQKYGNRYVLRTSYNMLLQASSPWQRYISADVAGTTSGGDVTAAYCPVCSPVYASAHAQYQRYAVPSRLNNACCRRPDLDVFRSPDLLGPLADTSGAPAPPTLDAVALRTISCSAPDLIELSARLPVHQEPEQDVDGDEASERAGDRQVRCVTSFPVRHVSQSTVVVCGQVSPSRGRHRTQNDED